MLALWALKTLQARGFDVPGDVAVTGFNNSIEERLATPPLTTVDLPFYNQGAHSVDLLLAQLERRSGAGVDDPALQPGGAPVLRLPFGSGGAGRQPAR